MAPKAAKIPTDLIQRFKQLQLHSKPETEEDDYDRPFVLSAAVKEEHNGIIYGCAFNPYLGPHETQLMATVGLEYLHVYKVPADTNKLIPFYALHVPTDHLPKTRSEREGKVAESLYSVAWAYDEYAHRQNKNPHRLVFGGHIGQVFVIDSVTRKQCNTLRSFGSEINDIRVNPANSNLIATACADMSIRIHHIRNASPLVVIGGSRCHKGNVLTVDWHFTGSYIISSGHDHLIMKWDLMTPPVKNHIDRICKALENGKQNQFQQVQQTNDEEKQKEYDEAQKRCEEVLHVPLKVSKIDVKKDPAAAVLDVANNFAESCNNNAVWPIIMPVAEASDVHNNYVDCVRVLPGIDYIMSKSCDTDRTINLWRFGPPAHQQINKNRQAITYIETCTSLLQTRTIHDAEVFFQRFDIDPRRRWMACPGIYGNVRLYDLRSPKANPHASLKSGNDNVRQVSFSPCGRFLCSVSDDCLVSRFDRVHKSVNQDDLKNFI